MLDAVGSAAPPTTVQAVAVLPRLSVIGSLLCLLAIGSCGPGSHAPPTAATEGTSSTANYMTDPWRVAIQQLADWCPDLANGLDGASFTIVADWTELPCPGAQSDWVACSEWHYFWGSDQAVIWDVRNVYLVAGYNTWENVDSGALQSLLRHEGGHVVWGLNDDPGTHHNEADDACY